MISSIDPVRADMRLAQLLGDNDLMAQAPYPGSTAVAPAPAAESPAAAAVTAPSAAAGVNFSGSIFEDILSSAIEALNGVSKSELYANQMVQKYTKGEVDMQDVLIAQAKMSVVEQFAITTVNTAVSTFKEITQIQM